MELINVNWLQKSQGIFLQKFKFKRLIVDYIYLIFDVAEEKIGKTHVFCPLNNFSIAGQRSIVQVRYTIVKATQGTRYLFSSRFY